MARFVQKWFAEWEPEPPRFGRATQLLNCLIEERPNEAWEHILALISQAREESLGYVAAGPLEDLLSRHGLAIIDRVEETATSNPRFASCLTGVWGHISFEPSVYARIQNIVHRL